MRSRVVGGFVIELGTRVLGEDDIGIALEIHHFGCRRTVVVELEGVGRQACERRRTLEADLDEPLDAERTAFGCTEEKVLRLDPAHGTRELPREQLDENDACQTSRVSRMGVPVGEHGVERLGRHQCRDLFDERAVECEQPRHEIRDVAPDEDVGIDPCGQQFVELAAELGHTGAQHRRMERDVDARYEDERSLAAEFGSTTLDLVFEMFETANGTRDGVLRAEKVEVDDLQELADRLPDLRDERLDVGVGEAELTRANGRHAIVAAPQVISRDQMVHGLAALEHHLEDGLEWEHSRACREGVVLADRVSTGDGTVDESARFLELSDLRDAERRHRDLGELSQVQHTVGVVVGGSVGHEGGGVVANDREDREPESSTCVLVRAIPDGPGGLRARPGVEPHALALDALAREGVDGARSREKSRGTHHQGVADLAGHLDDLAAVVETDTVDADRDRISGANHPQVASRPPDDRAWRRSAIT